MEKTTSFYAEKLAKLVDIHVNTVIRWENGSRDPRVNELQKLAQILNVTEAELLNGPAKREFEVKIMMGLKSLTALAGVEVVGNSFLYGVDDNEPQIIIAGKVRIDTQAEREKDVLS